MSLEAWVAIAGLAFTVLSAIVGGAFVLGKHSQRITTLEDKTQDIGSLAVLAANLSGLKEQLERLELSWSRRVDQLEHDLRNLLTGKLQPARRRDGGD